MIALAAGAFYFILPQLAQVGGSFKAFQSAHWGWVPVILFMSFLTYLASAFGMIGTVPEHIPFTPDLVGAIRFVVRQPGVARQCRRYGRQRSIPSEERRRSQPRQSRLSR